MTTCARGRGGWGFVRGAAAATEWRGSDKEIEGSAGRGDGCGGGGGRRAGLRRRSADTAGPAGLVVPGQPDLVELEAGSRPELQRREHPADGQEVEGRADPRRLSR